MSTLNQRVEALELRQAETEEAILAHVALSEPEDADDPNGDRKHAELRLAELIERMKGRL